VGKIFATALNGFAVLSWYKFKKLADLYPNQLNLGGRDSKHVI
jgi:hypothetical protein